MNPIRLPDSDADARSVASRVRRGETPERARAVVAARPPRGPVDVGATMAKKGEELRRQFAIAEAELRENGVFERTQAEEDAHRDREEREARAKLVKNLTRRGIARKHARVLAGEVPFDEPSVVELPDGKSYTSHFALRATRRWRKSYLSLLVLCGIKGCGKSLAAGEAAHAAGGRVVPASLLYRHAWIWNKVDKNGQPIRSPVLNLCTADLFTTPLLVIDDIGLEDERDRRSTIEAVETITRLRCDAGKDTMLPNNFKAATPEHFEAHRLALAAGKPAKAREALHGTIYGYFDEIGRVETFATRVGEYGKVLQCPAEDLRAQEAAERRAKR